ncbi:CoA transferase [Ralstonia solanacearum]|uniref:CoA transferase n=1 Tax=Ralstonia solanacearum TaxID=305 RepID=A0AAE3NFH8_RALSL|nr:CoA transferase [Ralstonia solanacearum]MBB6584192.1 CoA transferase [Ralstonia solanacearum]MDB0520054.1 CoA transferase [Ralstonia solanacearum]
MNTLRPLGDCTLIGLPGAPTSLFGPVASSLRYQSAVLGMPMADDAEGRDGVGRLSFALQLPEALPIACDIDGWPDAPGEAGRTATDFTVQAACGLMSVHGRASGRAQGLGVSYVSTLAASLALQGVFAAAIGQRRGLPGRRVSISLASAALLAVGQYLAGATAPDMPEAIRPGSTSVSARSPFVSADGVVFELETLDALPWRAFWAEAGVDMEAAGKGWHGFLLRYARAVAPLPAALLDALARLPYARIAEIAGRAGVSICPVRSLRTRASDEAARQMWQQGPWTFTRERCEGDGLPLPPATGTLPLSGLTVVESCRRIQGPLAGHLLALLGASVVRIEPPGGDPLRGMPPLAGDVSARFDALNRLKTVREIDIRTAHGRAEIHALVSEADVFLHNWAPGKAAALQLDSADLKRVNPALIYAYAGGWGPGSEPGLPGTDFVAQAYSGVAHRIASASGTGGGSLFTVLDVLGGAIAAQGVTAALLGRCLQPAGMRVESSLLGAATLLCANELATLFQPDSPSSVAGQGLQGVFPTRHGLLAIDCPDAPTVSALAQAVGLDGMADVHARLPDVLLARSAQQWLALLTPCGVPSAVVIEDLTDLHGDARLADCLTRDAYTRVNAPWRFA